jgi:chromosome segregation ATPase
MKKTKKLLSGVVGIALVAGMMNLTACGGVSEEQMAQLETLRAEVKSLDKQVVSLKEEKAKLEREIAEKNAKLEQCNRTKQQTKDNLGKMNK